MTHAYVVGNAFQDVATANLDWTDGNISTYGASAIRDGYADRRADSGGEETVPVELVIDFGTTTPLAGVGIINHNLAAEWTTPTVAVANSADGMSYTPILTATAITTTRRGLVVRDSLLAWASSSARYWKLSFSQSSGTPMRIVKLGELVGVTAFTSLARTASYGEGESLEYFRAEATMSNGDLKASLLGGPLATRSMRFADLNDSQRTEVLTMWHATQGGTKALLWVPDYSASANAAANQECIFGRLTPTLGWTQPDWELFDIDGFVLRACGRHVGA